MDRLNIKNFKSIGEISLELNKITLLFGDIATGKTNITESLKFLSSNTAQTIRSMVKFNNKLDWFNDESNDIVIEFNGKQYCASLSHNAVVVQRRDNESDSYHQLYRISGDKHQDFQEIHNNIGKRIILPTSETIHSSDHFTNDQRACFDDQYPYGSDYSSGAIERSFYEFILSHEDALIVFNSPHHRANDKRIAEFIVLDSNNNQFLIETSSDIFTRCLIEKTKPEDINIYIVYLDNRKTKVKKLYPEEIINFELDLLLNADQFYDTGE